MSNLETRFPGPPTDGPSPGAKRKGRWQVGLSTLALLMALVAVGMSYVVNRREIAALRSRIEVMRPLTRELIVEDPSKIAVVKQDPAWFDENLWDIHLPDGRYRLFLGTREVEYNGMGQGKPSRTFKSVPIEAGRHRLALDKHKEGEAWRVRVLQGDKEILSVEEPLSWDLGHGSMGGGQFDRLEQIPADRPVFLYRRRFMNHQSSPNQWAIIAGPGDGLMLWIEPVPAPDAPSG
ncbi:hypothetical protein P12x_000724 [Tundrisphaera lichenicola]|uniref:hypothetical protein n=1 Tax=Tundrisphaera lichenicola TaxID=2029860 RepID=UPI003EBAC7E2